MSGAATYGFKSLVGKWVDKKLFDYLGTKKGWAVQIVLYFGLFLYGQSILARQKNMDINHLVNPRDKTGEIMMKIILSEFPHKVDQKRLREILLEKNEYQIMHFNNI